MDEGRLANPRSPADAKLAGELQRLTATPDPLLHELVAIAAGACRAPAAWICFLDDGRPVIKAPVGVTCSNGEPFFAALSIAEPLIIPDLAADSRSALLLSRAGVDPPIASYAAVPILLEDGMQAGVLAIADHVVRRFSADEMTTLARIARQVAGRLDGRREVMSLRNAVSDSRENEEQYRRILRSAEQGIWEITSAGMTTFVNEKLARTLGYTPEEMLGRSVYDFISQDHLEPARGLIESRRSGKRSVHEFPLQRRDGSTVWMLVSAAPAFNADGTIVGAVAMMTDITTRRFASEAMRFTQFAIDHASEAVFLMDASGKILYVNAAACRHLGYSAEELTAFNVMDIDPRLTPEVWVDLFASLQRSGFLRLETLHQGKDGQTRQVEISANYFEFGGAGYSCAFTRDLTEQVRIAREVSRLNRALHAITRLNQKMVRTSDWSDLLDEVCRVIVEVGGYRLAWVGRLEEDGRVVPVARAGVDDGYVDAANVSLQDPVRGSGPMGTSIRTGRPAFIRDTASDPSFRVWRKEALKRGYAACLALPLRTGRGIYGALGIYSSETGAFDQQELELMTELASDVSYGLSSIETANERQRAEQALRESEAQYRGIFEASTDGMIISDFAGRILEVNPAACRIHGYTREEMLNLKIEEIIHPDELSGYDRGRDAVRNGTSINAIARNVRKDGSVFDVDVYATQLLYRGQSAMLGLIRDITERKRAEEGLRTSEERLRRVVETMPIIISAFDEQGAILTWNEECARVTGYSRDEIVGNPKAMQLLYPDPAFLQQRMAEWQEKGDEFRNWEWPVRCKDGSTRYIAWSNVSGRCRIPGWARWGVGIDITERKLAESQREHLEQQLRQSQKMEAIGKLAAGVAHDFNNLLTAILGNAELLRTWTGKAASALPAGVPDALAEIERAVERATGLTQQLLAFSRRQVRHVIVLDPNRIVRDMERMLRRLIGDDIVLTPHLEPDVRLVRADGGQLEQVLLNLVLNARDAMPQGGSIDITTANVAFDEAYASMHMNTRPGEHVLISVRDTGTGMDAEVLEHIFEPFFTTKPVGSGSGLGLATVYGIITQAGGHIEVDSAPGKGSTFRIYLPASDAAETGADAVVSGETPGGSETVLVCEDQDMVRRLACRLLSFRGYKVLEAAGPAEAIEIAARHEGAIQLLVSDVLMPGMNGRDLATRLLQRNRGMRVLLVSGYAADLADEGKPRRFSFLQKPYNQQQLLQRVRQLLDAPPEP